MKGYKGFIYILLLSFAVGFIAHIGANTAKLIWPNPPWEIEVYSSE